MDGGEEPREEDEEGDGGAEEEERLEEAGRLAPEAAGRRAGGEGHGVDARLGDRRRPEPQEEVEGGDRVEEPLGPGAPRADDGHRETGGREERGEEAGPAGREERDDAEGERGPGVPGEDDDGEERGGEGPGARAPPGARWRAARTTAGRTRRIAGPDASAVVTATCRTRRRACGIGSVIRRATSSERKSVDTAVVSEPRRSRTTVAGQGADEEPFEEDRRHERRAAGEAAPGEVGGGTRAPRTRRRRRRAPRRRRRAPRPPPTSSGARGRARAPSASSRGRRASALTGGRRPTARSKKSSESRPVRPRAVISSGPPRATSLPLTRTPASSATSSARESWCVVRRTAAPSGRPLPQPRDEEPLRERVEADHRLVEDEEARVVEERLREGHLLPRAVGERLVRPVGRVVEAERRQLAVRSAPPEPRRARRRPPRRSGATRAASSGARGRDGRGRSRAAASPRPAGRRRRRRRRPPAPRSARGGR